MKEPKFEDLPIWKQEKIKKERKTKERIDAVKALLDAK